MADVTYDDVLNAFLGGASQFDTSQYLNNFRDNLISQLNNAEYSLDSKRIYEIEQLARRADDVDLQNTLRVSWDNIIQQLYQYVDDFGRNLT